MTTSYQLYRNTTLGHTLQESLDELIQVFISCLSLTDAFFLLYRSRFVSMNCMCCIQSGQITPNLALKVLLQFDKAINTALANRVKNRVHFKVVKIVIM